MLADEINRATPKTQSALLEAMQEQSVTVGKQTYALPPPFFVLATQNPIEMEGTYPLPEAQLDRFTFKLRVDPPARDELHAILDRTTGSDEPAVRPVLGRERLLEMRALVRQVPVARPVQDFAVRLVEATHPARSSVAEVKRFVRYGSSPRGAQAVILAAKIEALRDGRFAPSFADVRRVALPALRHRVLLNFDGEAEGVTADAVVAAVLLAELPEMAVMASARAAADTDRARDRAGRRFDERFLRKLESLVLTIRRSARMSGGLLRANRASKRVGAGLEFADHRDYAAGDDLRYLDWNLYGRLERLALRLFQEEEDLLVEVLVDASASMGVRRPAQARSRAADRRRARLRRPRQPGSRRAHARSVTTTAPALPPARGKGAILPILRFLDGVQANGRVGLAAAVRGVPVAAAPPPARAGDRHLRFLRSGRPPRGAGSAAAPPAGGRRHPGERAARSWRPTLRGDVELRDVETGEIARADDLAGGAGRRTAQRHQALLRDLEGYCRERAIPCFTRRLRPAVRRGRAAHVPRGRPAALSDAMRPGVAAVRPVAGARRRRRRRGRRRGHHGAATWCACGGAAWSCRSRRCGWTRPAPRRTTSWARRLRDLAVAAAGAGVCSALLLLAGGRPAARRPPIARGRSLVVLIDRSASMSARDGAGTRLDAAPRRARTRSSTAWPPPTGPWSRRSRPTPSPRAASRPTRGRLRRAVAAVAPSEEPGDLPRALTFAAAILRGRPRPTVVLVSDGALQRRGPARDPGRPRRPLRGRSDDRAARRQRRHHLVRGAAPPRRSRRGRGGAGRAELRPHDQRRSRSTSPARRRHRGAPAPGRWAPASAGGTSCPTCSRPTRACKRGC